MKTLALAAVFLGAAAHAFGVVSGSQPRVAPTIPLCAGLRIVTAISDAAGDYESIKTVESVRGSTVKMKFSAEHPNPKSSGVRTVRSTRSVAVTDLAHATRYARIFSEIFPESLAGTTALGASAAVLESLKANGEAELAMPDEGMLAGIERGGNPEAVRDIEFAPETIHRVGRVMVPVLVNDARVELPAIHARGEFFGEPAEFFFLDDVNNPISLRYAVARGDFSDLFGAMTAALGGGDATDRDTRDVLNVVKISYRCDGQPVEMKRAPTSSPPLPAAAGQALERALAETGRAEIYSIFFSFNSDRLRDESQPTLDEIAAVLARHPEWKLSIEGHTDNIGSDERNLDLSRRRSAAVKTALVVHNHVDANRLATTGFGKARPRDTNETLEGRARNRRVELVRLP